MAKIVIDEKGQVLALALIALGVGALLLTPFLNSLSTNVLASRKYKASIVEQYAADAGIEDAIWNVTYGDFGSTVLSAPGDTTNYSLGEPVNGVTPSITITRGSGTLASDDFESGDFSGGNGWLYDWASSGDVKVLKQGAPHGGTYHLRMRKSSSYVERAVDLTGKSGLRLQLWAKVDSLEDTDYVEGLVSSDYTNWTVIKTWTSADSDDTYHFSDIDLSPFTMSGEFWIAFYSGMDKANDRFFIDDLVIADGVAGVPYEIVSSVGDETIRAAVIVNNGNVTITSWENDRLPF